MPQRILTLRALHSDRIPPWRFEEVAMKDLVLKICAMTVMLLSLVSTTHLFAE
jgi:hypothetical protein